MSSRDRPSSKDSSSRSSKGGSSSSSSSRSSRPRTAQQIRDADYQENLKKCLESHCGYLTTPLQLIAASLDITIPHLSIALAVIYFVILLLTPSFLLPHFSGLITFIIPVSNTLRSIARELDKQPSIDSAQWSLFWGVWCIFQLISGWIGIFRPGCKAIFEIIRTGALITVGGPWFGKLQLRPDGPSAELKEAEKKETQQEKERKADKERSKAKKEKAKETDKAREIKEKDKEKEKAKAKARSK